MTTAKYSGKSVYMHTFKRALTGSLGVAVLCLFIMLLLIPVSTAIIPDSSIFNLDYTHHQMKYRFFYESLRPLVNGMAILSGIIIAITLNKFMLTRRTSDAYFSFGIKRERLLVLHSVSGIIQIFFVISIPMFISMIMNIKAFGDLEYAGVIYSSVIVSGFVYMTAGLFILALIGFGITTIVCCLVGTITEATVFSIIILAGPSIIFYGINALAKKILFGNAFGISTSSGGLEVSKSLLNKLDFLNPVMFFWETSKHYNIQKERFDGYVLPDMEWLRIIGWLAAFIIIIILAGLVIKRRRAEVSGVSGKSHVLHFIITFLLCFLGYSVTLNFSYSAGIQLAIGAAVFVFLIVYAVSEILQVRRLKKSIWKLPLQLGIILIFTIVLCTGGFGYSSRIPEPDNIESVKMSYVGTPNYLNGQPGGTSDGSQYYLSSTYSFSDTEDIETVINLHKELIEAGKGILKLSSLDFSSTTVPYDIIVSYKLKDGSDVTRYYDRATYEVLEKMLSLDDTATISKSMVETITNGDGLYYASGAYKNGTVYVSNNWYTNPKQLVLSLEERSKLLNCIAKDVENQSVEQRYFPEETAKGIIMFTLSGSSDSLEFGYNFDNAVVYLTPDFTNTLKFFEDAGLSYCFEFTDEIESISLQAFNPYVSKVNSAVSPTSAFFMGYIKDFSDAYIQVKDFGADLELTDSEQINEISALLQNDYFMSQGGYLACVKIKGKEQYIYKFLPAKAAPDYIKNQLQD